ncbi:MAG: type II 3-dehydroquinate dehydratase [Flavobacteriales bacterium]
MKLLIVNGPNLNLLGSREQDIYGSRPFEHFLKDLQSRYTDVAFTYYQSNVEGEIINALQEAGEMDGIILNAGGYTHTSVAISDAVAAIRTPVVEVHISNIAAREEVRHTSLLSANCKGVIIGFGLHSYRLAVESFVHPGL